MLKVILQYTDCLQDGKRFFSILAKYPVVILKSKENGWSTKVKVTVIVPDYDALTELIYELNQRCIYEVRVVKMKQLKEKHNETMGR